MARITNDMRRAIVDAASGKLDLRVKEFEEREHVLGMEAYYSVYPKDILDHAEALPANWCRWDKCLRFNVRGMTLQFTVNEEVRTARVPSNSGIHATYGGCFILGVIKDDALADKLEKFAHEKQDLASERNKARNALMGMLDKVTTTKRLREVWPEGVKFYDHFDKDEPVPLPAIRVDEINKMFGI